MKLGLPTEPPDRPKVSGIAGDLRSALSAGSETHAEHMHNARFAGQRLENMDSIPLLHQLARR